MVNKYGGKCCRCHNYVAPNAGTLTRGPGGWKLYHLACKDAEIAGRDSGEPEVIGIRMGGRSYTRNRKGRCEDAPCCGCCTI